MDPSSLQKLAKSLILQTENPFVPVSRVAFNKPCNENPHQVSCFPSDPQLIKQETLEPAFLTMTNAASCVLCGTSSETAPLVQDSLDFLILAKYFKDCPELCQISSFCEVCHSLILEIKTLEAQLNNWGETLSNLVAGLKTMLRLRSEGHRVEDADQKVIEREDSMEKYVLDSNTVKDAPEPEIAVKTEIQESFMDNVPEQELEIDIEYVIETVKLETMEMEGDISQSDIYNPKETCDADSTYQPSSISTSSDFSLSELEEKCEDEELDVSSKKASSKSSASRPRLMKKKKVTTNKGKLECYFCSKAFPDWYRLARHLRVHTLEGNMRFQCPVCKKCLAKSQTFDEHMILVCGTDNAKKEELRKQKRESLAKFRAQKMYRCPCGERYSQKKLLGFHRKKCTEACD